MDKIKGFRSFASKIKSLKDRKWVVPTFLFIVFVSLIAVNMISFAHSKTNTVILYKAAHINPTQTPSPTPTLTPSPIPTATPIPPTATPIPPTPTQPLPDPSPTGSGPSAPAQTVNSSPSDYILAKVNEYRRSLGLYEVKPDPNTCNFANRRAGEITGSFSHDGFKNYPYPSYSKATENIAMNSNRDEVVNSWINSAPHAEILRADTPFACIGNLGIYYAFEGWKP